MLYNFNTTAVGQIALRQLDTIPENFFLYEMELIEQDGPPSTWNTIKLRGCVMRKSKSGKTKGQLCIPVKGTHRTFYVNKQELE